MKLTKLFSMQRELDAYIQQNRLEQTDVFLEKALALLIELAELANETRCFKFWSQKGPSADEVILEEYVDSIHFLLSLGIEKGFDDLEEWPQGEVGGELTQLFLETNGSIHRFLLDTTRESYAAIWINYGAVARSLGFTNDEIILAYLKKNEENYTRQNSGY